MTEREKAAQLFMDFYKLNANIRMDNLNTITFAAAKACAKKTADEIISVIDDFESSNHGKITNSYGQDYWQQVKTEIEKL